jgi:hypothetical protein
LRVDPFERAGVGRRRERDARRLVLAEREDALAPPRRHELERVLARRLEPDPLQTPVEHEWVDETRTVLVGLARDLVRERLHARRVRERDDLIVLDVGAHLDRERGEAYAVGR